MATGSDPAAAQQRRQQARRNLKRYMHTRSFNQLAGRNTAPGSDCAHRSSVPARIVLGLIAAGSIAIGLCFVFF